MFRIAEGHEEVVLENGLRLLECDTVPFPVADIFVWIPFKAHIRIVHSWGLIAE